MRILFLCTSNLHRSATAVSYFNDRCPQHEYRGAGLDVRNCKAYNTNFCTEEDLQWADRVFVMESAHKLKVMRYGDFALKTINLNIEDIYQHNDPALIKVFESKAELKFLFCT